MKIGDFARWCLLLADFSMAMPGVRRRQAQTTPSQCTCPADGPITTTVSQYTVVTYSTTVTTQSGTVISTGDSTSTQVVTAAATDTFTTTTDTVTNTYPGSTQTTTTTSTTTSTITTVVTQTTCVTSGLRKVKRQGTSATTSSASDSPSILTTTISSRGATCICRPIPKTTTLASTSSCDCPATTATTIIVTEDYTSSSIVTVSTTVPTVVTVTPTEFSTTIVTSTVTSATLASFDTTQSASTVTSQVIETVYTTYTSASTVTSCTSSSAIPSASGSLVCNSTAYLIETTNNVPRLYNINLRTSTFFALNSNVGAGRYTNINGMGFNVLDNFLYGIGTISSGNYAVVRISSTGATTEVLQFTSSTTSPGTAGDIDTNGQFWFTGSGGTVWRQVDLAPGSSTYGTIVASGTSTLSGYSVLDWVYLPGQGSYMYSLATSTDSSPNLVVLRWDQSAHTWSVYQEYQSISASNSIIANWGSNNGTIWGTAATSGQTTRVTLGGTPVNIGTAPSGLTSADGARCAIATDG